LVPTDKAEAAHTEAVGAARDAETARARTANALEEVTIERDQTLNRLAALSGELEVLRARMSELEAREAVHAEDDAKRKEAVEARNTAESMVHDTEKNLGEHGSKLTPGDKAGVESDVAALKEVLAGEDVAPEAALIGGAREEGRDADDGDGLAVRGGIVRHWGLGIGQIRNGWMEGQARGRGRKSKAEGGTASPEARSCCARVTAAAPSMRLRATWTSEA
jgi:hypothetical protein